MSRPFHKKNKPLVELLAYKNQAHLTSLPIPPLLQ